MMSDRLEAPWFETAFGDLYALLYAHRDEDSAARETAELLSALGSQPIRGPVLDLCCGAGRHLAALRTQSLRVVGMDLSPQLLALAAARDGLLGHLVRGDMRRLPFGTIFVLVVNLFTSFGYFPTDAENEAALVEMARVLRPGGRLVIDHIHRAHIERTLVPYDQHTVGGVIIEQRRGIRAARVEKRIDLSFPDGRTRRLLESVRIFTPDEMKSLMRTAGFERIRLCGTFAGDPLTEQSARMIAIGEKGSR